MRLPYASSWPPQRRRFDLPRRQLAPAAAAAARADRKPAGTLRHHHVDLQSRPFPRGRRAPARALRPELGAGAADRLGRCQGPGQGLGGLAQGLRAGLAARAGIEPAAAVVAAVAGSKCRPAQRRCRPAAQLLRSRCCRWRAIPRVGGSMKKVDRDAFERAIAQMRNDSADTRALIEEIIAKQGFEQAGETAAYHCQCRALRLRPWQSPPMYAAARTDGPDDGSAGWRVAELLAHRLLAAG